MFYAGLGKHRYKMVNRTILKSNRFAVTLLSACAVALTTAMFVSTFYVSGIKSNRIVYLLGSLMSLGIFLLAFLYAKKHEWITMLLVRGLYLVLYGYGIMIGIITDPCQKTVSFIVMLVFFPVLFIEKPIYLFCNSSLYIGIFVLLCFKVKTGSVLQNDVIDSLVFGMLGVFSGVLSSRTKVRSFIQEHELKVFSRTDELTKMNNRNLYQKRINSDYFYLISEKSLSCIYLDANGLHIINNLEGHEKGDEMLKFIANEIKTFFGEELTFRVGGDEFVIFVPDHDEKDIKRRLDKMIKNIEKAGYHVATGMATMRVDHLSMETLIKTADNKMYQEKKRYYNDSAHDRRKN